MKLVVVSSHLAKLLVVNGSRTLRLASLHFVIVLLRLMGKVL